MKCSPEDVAGGKYTRLVITPPPGQHPHPLRTDQVVYESYDQEKGIPGIPRLIPGCKNVKSNHLLQMPVVRMRLLRWMPSSAGLMMEALWRKNPLKTQIGQTTLWII